MSDAVETTEAVQEVVETIDSAQIDTPVEAVSDADLDWDNIPTMAQAEAEAKEDAVDEDWTEEVVAEEVKEEAAEEVIEDKKEEILKDNEEKEVEEVIEEIEVKVDGELEKVSLEDLKSNYAGKVAYDKKFQELDAERTAYRQEVEEINNYVNTFGEKARSGDMVSAMQYFGEFAGIAPYQMKEMLVKQLSNEVYRRETLTEEELSFEQGKEKLNYEQESLKSEQERQSKEQAAFALQGEISKARETYEVSESEWNEAFSELDELLEPHEQITPDMVGKFAYEYRLDDKAVNLLSEFSDRVEATDEVIEGFKVFIEDNASWSDDQFKAQLELELQAMEETNVKSELSETVSKQEAKKQKKAEIKTDHGFSTIQDEHGTEIDDFDDL